MADMSEAARITVQVAALQRGRGEVTGQIEALELTNDEIEQLIAESVSQARTAAVTLKGVRAGGDIFVRLGGANSVFFNARQQFGIWIVQGDKVGFLEFVFDV